MKTQNLRLSYCKGKFKKNIKLYISFSHELKTPLNGGIIPL